MPTILILSSRRVKIIRALLTSRSARARRRKLTSIAHLPRNVTTSSELSRWSLSIRAFTPFGSRNRTYPPKFRTNFRRAETRRLPRRPLHAYEFHPVSGARVSLASACPSRKFPKMDRANVERGRDRELMQNLQTVAQRERQWSIKLSHRHTERVPHALSRNARRLPRRWSSTIPIRAPIDADWHAFTAARDSRVEPRRAPPTDWLTDWLAGYYHPTRQVGWLSVRPRLCDSRLIRRVSAAGKLLLRWWLNAPTRDGDAFRCGSTCGNWGTITGIDILLLFLDWFRIAQ